jgi:hypothetical protein
MSKASNAQPPKEPCGLEETEWNFCRERVPDRELVACCFWEYARESAFIRGVRERSLKHWMPLYSKARWWDSPQDKNLHRDLQTIQSIGYPAEVFLRGISCPPDDVLPDAPPLKPGEVHSTTGSFPKPWQNLSAKERDYRSHLGTDVSRIPLVPFERGHAFEAKDIREWVESHRREIHEANATVRRKNPKKTEEALLREGKLQFPTIAPSLYSGSGKEMTVVGIHWGSFTDDEIASYFRKWVRANRPSHIPAPNDQGKKLNDWRVALNRLGIMRALHVFTFADKRFPEAFKERGEKHCYTARKLALEKFAELLPFLPKEEKPIRCVTKGRRSK